MSDIIAGSTLSARYPFVWEDFHGFDGQIQREDIYIGERA